MTGTPPPSTGTFRLTTRFWIVLGSAVFLIIAVILAGVLYARAASPDDPMAEPTATRPLPSDAPGAAAAPTIEPAPSIDPDDTRPRPADCAALFSPDMADAMSPYVLNPEWAASEGPEVIGTTDPELAAILTDAEKLSCHWGSQEGAGGVFMFTNFAWISEETQGAALDRLQAVGYECYDEMAGTRCTIDTSNDGNEVGESHFLRGGVWIASRWSDLAPYGYTHDIIANTFG